MVYAAGSISYVFDGFRIDGERRLLFRAEGGAVALKPKVFDTLLYLVSNNARLIEKDELMAAVWPDTVVEENNLNKNISAIRQALGEDPHEHRFIVTVPGRGYRFVADVRPFSPVVEPAAHIASSTPTEILTVPPHRTRYVLMVSATLVIALLVITGAFYWNRDRPAGIPRTIAILPFRPLVAEQRDEALELGMADTLISRLGSRRGLIVRPLSSVRNFGGLEDDPVASGRALNVEVVLDGNIQRAGERIRINVRLFRVADGSMLWSQTFDENFSDIFVVQDAISTRISGVLELQLGKDDGKQLTKRETDNVEAYQSYLKGRFHLEKYAPDEHRKALAFFLEAVKLDPTFAAAHASLGYTYATLAGTPNFPRRETVARGKENILRSIELDDQLSMAHEAYGDLLYRYDHDFVAAERELKRAIDLDPGNASARETYGSMLIPLGRHEEALAEMQRAAELDPLSVSIRASVGNSLFHARRYDDAIVEYKKALDLDPFSYQAHDGLSTAYQMQGNYAESVAERARMAEIRNDAAGAAFMRESFARGGWLGFARDMTRDNAGPQMLPYQRALLLAELGEKDRVIDILSGLMDEGSSQVFLLKVDPRLDSLRDDPRFADLVRRLIRD